MRTMVTLTGEKKIILPVGFYELLQGFIYSNINDEWLHEVGFSVGKRSFKLFVFSSILQKGSYEKAARQFIFPQKISFLISSPVNWILEKFAVGLLKSKHVFIGNNELAVESISVMSQNGIDKNTLMVKALTPIEVHSTFEVDGKKKTHYYAAGDSDFSHMVESNLKKKWESLFKKPCPYEIKVSPSGFNEEKVVRFGTGRRYVIVKGWMGNFKLVGAPEFLKFALDAGLGSRNSQGFGMVEVINGQ